MRIPRKALSMLLLFPMIFGLAACGSASNEPKPQNTFRQPATEGEANSSTGSDGTATPGTPLGKNEAGIKVKVMVGNQALTATFIDNATSRSLISKFPLTLPMMDLYSREMCYRFPDPLPANEAQTSGYEVGDISYWTPRHSFIILYKQNGEVISNLQKIGHIDAGVEIFEKTGNVNIRFELLDK